MWRRSSTTPLAPWLICLWTAVLTSACGPEVNPARRTHAIFAVLGLHLALDDRHVDLLALEVHVARLAVLETSSVTEVPARPLISAVDSSDVLPASDLPLTLTIRSPTFSPPCLAGEPS